MSIMYHDGNRQLQDRFESRRIADRLDEAPDLANPTVDGHIQAGADMILTYFAKEMAPLLDRRES